jgi:hypothetical protein
VNKKAGLPAKQKNFFTFGLGRDDANAHDPEKKIFLLRAGRLSVFLQKKKAFLPCQRGFTQRCM